MTTAWALGAIYGGKLGLTLNPSLATLVAALCCVFSVSPVYVGVLYLLPPDGHQQALKGPGMSASALRCGTCAALSLRAAATLLGACDMVM